MDLHTMYFYKCNRPTVTASRVYSLQPPGVWLTGMCLPPAKHLMSWIISLMIHQHQWIERCHNDPIDLSSQKFENPSLNGGSCLKQGAKSSFLQSLRAALSQLCRSPWRSQIDARAQWNCAHHSWTSPIDGRGNVRNWKKQHAWHNSPN